MHGVEGRERKGRRDGTIVATPIVVTGETKAHARQEDDLERSPCTLRVPCPGSAHRTGEVCLICDEDSDGTITVVVTEPEIDALGRSAHGYAVDLALLPRLFLLGLLSELGGIVTPTAQGCALLRTAGACSN